MKMTKSISISLDLTEWEFIFLIQSIESWYKIIKEDSLIEYKGTTDQLKFIENLIKAGYDNLLLYREIDPTL